MANTTSGSYTFDKTFAVDDIIAEAYERVGSQVTSGNQMRSARRSLNILFQEWGNRGLHYWEVGETNMDLVEGQSDYDFFRTSGDGTSATTVTNASASETIYGMSDILEAKLRNGINTVSQADSALGLVSRSIYGNYANKKSKSTPSNIFVERLIDKVRLHVYPTPDSSNASKYIHLFYIKRIQDVDSTYTDATDIPFRFVPCMVSGLAFYLAQKFNPQLVQQMKLLYEDELARALAEDGSDTSTHITPKVYYPTT